MLKVRGLQKSFGEIHAVRGIDLEVEAGAVVALLGRNGAGKSTALSMIAGLLKPDSGNIVVDGVDVWDQPAGAAALVGIAPQETGIYRVLTVRENLEFFGTLSGLDRRQRRRRAIEIAERLGLEELLERPASQLSGGESRRLHTGCALVHRPPLLLLDEPTVGADVATRNQLIATVRDLADEGSAVIYTTHYLPEVEDLEAEIVVIDQGRILGRGFADDLIASNFAPSVEVTLGPAADLAAAPAFLELEPRQLGAGRFRIERQLRFDDLVHRLGPITADVISVQAARPSLEQVFLSITGASLDDASRPEDGAVAIDVREQPNDQATS